MSRLASTLGAATLCVALLASVPQTADAQARYQAPTNQVDVTAYAQARYQAPTNTADITAYTGWDFPTLDLQDAASSGPMIGLSGGVRLHEQVTLRFDGNASFLGSSDYGQGVEGPSMTMLRLTSGVEVNLFDPQLTKWRFLVSGHAGWAFLSSGDLPQSRLTTTTEGISTDGPVLGFGTEIGYPVTESTLIYFGGRGYYHNIAGGPDTQPVQRLNMGELGNWK
ncbi:MAG: hypothetical protein ABEJ46_02945, partial [Gemmatimonadota bacterium]